MIRIGILVFDGFDELDAVGPFEVLSVAARLVARGQREAPLSVALVAEEAPRTVAGSNGLVLQVDATLDGPFDWLVVPGGNWATRAPKGAYAEATRGVLPRRIAELAAAGTLIASVCTGAMLVERAGLAKGKPGTTHAVARRELASAGVEVREERVVDAGDWVSAGGVTSGIDLGLHLVERLVSRDLRKAVATHLEVKP